MPSDPAALRRSITAIALRQAGYFTAVQARQVGYTYQAQKYHVDHGNWVRADRGIFRLPDWPAQQEDQYVLWWLWSGHRAVVSHASALAVHDLGDVTPTRVDLTVPRGFRAHHPSVVLHMADLPSADVEDRNGYRITTVERTVLDVAASDLSQEQLDLAVAEALERGAVSARRLRLARTSTGTGPRFAWSVRLEQLGREWGIARPPRLPNAIRAPGRA